jgi:hypothetical protein
MTSLTGPGFESSLSRWSGSLGTCRRRVAAARNLALLGRNVDRDRITETCCGTATARLP